MVTNPGGNMCIQMKIEMKQEKAREEAKGNRRREARRVEMPLCAGGDKLPKHTKKQQQQRLRLPYQVNTTESLRALGFRN